MTKKSSEKGTDAYDTQLTLSSTGGGLRGADGILAELLVLTRDAVIVFDGTGRIVLANAEAQALLGQGTTSLVDTDVRHLFLPVQAKKDVHALDAPAFHPSALPFAMDGTSTSLTCVDSEGMSREISVRADRVSAADETYLLVAAAVAGTGEQRECDRLVGELARANRRLSGTLEIVLGTIDAVDVTTLFTRVLEGMTQTMEASGTLLYLTENDRMRLRAMSSGMDAAHVPHHLDDEYGLLRAAHAAGGSLRLRIVEPRADDLRQGHLTSRELINEETQQTHRVSAAALPPFVSMILVPVWFGGHIIASLVIGWQRPRQLSRDDSRLVEAVGHYLSTQLAGAVSTLRQQRATELNEYNARLRQRIAQFWGDREELSVTCLPLDIITDPLEHALTCRVIPVTENRFQTQTVVATFPDQLERELPLAVDRILDGKGSVVACGSGTPLGDWLTQEGESPVGAYVDCGVLGEVRSGLLLLRPADEDAFDDLELAFLRRFVDDVRDLSRDNELRHRDRYISQALQTGMRNELQQVKGITAQGIYTSATEAAFVGGDFYDLIRLPKRRACIIMGDVSGKGVEAASVSAAVKTALGAYSWEGLRPARMVHLLNEFLLGFSRLETFATLFVGIVELDVGRLTYCSAGHPPAVLVRAATGDLMTLDVQSGVVGAFSEMSYRDGSVEIEQDDMLLLYTDGTTEARALDGSFFGEQGLRDAVMAELPAGFDGLLDRLLDRLDVFTGRRLDDDVAMIALRFDTLGDS